MTWTSQLVEEMNRWSLASRAEHSSKLAEEKTPRRLAIRGHVLAASVLSLLVLAGSLSNLQPRFVLAAAAEPLHLEVFTADEDSWGVTSTLIYGKTEALLIDAQFHNSQARKLAERIADGGAAAPRHHHYPSRRRSLLRTEIRGMTHDSGLR